MPPKTKGSKKREVKPKKPKQKQKQKQKQQQNVKINVTQGGSGGGGGTPIIIPPQTPMQFRDTSGENVRLTGLIKDLENRIAGFKQPIAITAPIAIKEPVSNPANDPITTRSVYNAPITYNDDLREEIMREIAPPPIPRNPPVEVPTGFNAPITYNDTLGEEVIRGVMGDMINEVETRNAPAPSFEEPVVVEQKRKKTGGRKKGVPNKPKAPATVPAQPQPIPQIPSTFLTNIGEGDITPSEFEDVRQRRNRAFTTPYPKIPSITETNTAKLPTGFKFGLQNEPRIQIAESDLEFA
jgi:hypothetical protein